MRLLAKEAGQAAEATVRLVVENLAHTRTFTLARFFACVIYDFIQKVMLDPWHHEGNPPHVFPNISTHLTEDAGDCPSDDDEAPPPRG